MDDGEISGSSSGGGGERGGGISGERVSEGGSGSTHVGGSVGSETEPAARAGGCESGPANVAAATVECAVGDRHGDSPSLGGKSAAGDVNTGPSDGVSDGGGGECGSGGRGLHAEAGGSNCDGGTDERVREAVRRLTVACPGQALRALAAAQREAAVGGA